MLYNLVKKFFSNFIFLILAISFVDIQASYGMLTDIEVFDEYQHASSKQYVIKLDCYSDFALSSTHMLECDFKDTFINNFSICNKNKKTITTLSVKLFENSNIVSAYVLKSPDLISKLLEQKLRFKFSPSFTLDKKAYDYQYDQKRDAVVYIKHNNINACLDVGDRFYCNGNLIICRQPRVSNQLLHWQNNGLSIQENCKTRFENNKIYFKNTLTDTNGQKHIYAADKEGTLYIDFERLANHHSHILTSALQDLGYGYGNDASCAGTIQIKNGKVTYLSNDSGHYEPSLAQLVLFAKYLNCLNLLSDDVVICSVTSSQQTLYSLTDLNNFDEQNLLRNYSSYREFPSLQESIQNLQTIIEENLTADRSQTSKATPFSLNKTDPYQLIGHHVGFLMPTFPEQTSALPCPVEMLNETFNAYGITWNATISGEFTRSDIISHLLATTHYPDGLLHYHYQVNSPVSVGSKKLGILSLKGRSQNSGSD